MYIELFFGVQEGSLTIDDVKKFIETHPEENLHLEFKGGAFFEANKKDALTAAVTSFANSDGGLLIIGVGEKKEDGRSYGANIDGVENDTKHSKEALENILISSISPKIDFLKILRLEDNGKSVFILEIPKSERAPHMASDHRYYKRLNFGKIPMENYEVEDYMLGRKKTPKLTAKFILSNGSVQDNFLRFSMDVQIRNLGRIMAKYVLLVLEIKGVEVVSPIPNSLNVLKRDQNVTVLQYGPSSNTTIVPSPSERIVWTVIGKLTLQVPTGTSIGTTESIGIIRYGIMHEELPETDGFFDIKSGFLQSVLSGQGVDISSPNEKFLY